MRRALRVRLAAGVVAALACISAAPGSAASLEARVIDSLRAAEAARAGRDFAAAARGFDEAAQVAEIRAPARLLAAHAWLEAEQPERAEASTRAALDANAAAPWDGDLFEALARAREAQGDAAGARRAWREALARGVDPARANAVRIAYAASLADAGEVDASAAVLRDAWIEGAASPGADEAERRLAALEARAGRALRTGSAWLARADRLFALQRTEASLAAYERALGDTLAEAERTHARRRRAECLFRARRYPAAAAAFAALGPSAESRVWHARALARAGDVESAIGELEAIAAGPASPTAGWAAQLAGLLHEGRGRDVEAQTLFRVAAREGDPKVAGDALWRLGFGAWRARDLAGAQRNLAALAEREADPIQRQTARYWLARARGDDRALLAAIAREYPFTFYGGQARDRLLALDDAAPDPRGEGAPVELGAPTLGEAELFPARVLAAAGCEAVARRASDALTDRATSLADRVALARLHASLGDPHRAQALLVRSAPELLARGPRAGEDEIWRLAWPDAFAAERRAARGPDAKLDPWLVVALMREESGFRPDAVSVTGAVGLLQLMPDTARRLAREVGLGEVPSARWIDPALNVRLGTAYLEQLMRRFGGRTAAVVASYNAGPAVVETWRAPPGGDPVEWIEAIPYEETRGYVKRVLRSQRVYWTLYR